MRQIRVNEAGGPEVLAVEDVVAPTAGDGEALVRLHAAGVNFIDVNQRSGAYPVSLPFTPGTEGAGVVESIGAGVGEVSVGDRVAFAGVPGAYGEHIAVRANRLVPVPDPVDDESAAAVLLQGMTAHYLVHSVCPVVEGDWCLVHAAAGGVGLLLTQLARRSGLRVIGTVSTPEKAERARDAGAERVVDYSEEDFAAAVREHTDGAGVRVVYESVGKTTFDRSLGVLAPRGYMVLFGQASGPVAPVDPRSLQQGGSLYMTRPQLADYTRSREELLWRGQEVLGLVGSGELRVHVHQRYPLEQASEAHRALQGRRTTGKLILIP
ncbi:MAG: zinc-binding dehydrogenase [Actinobacteria bacterium]|nr:zinc-binding dehydrogenase [Actinomycetota bacterium]